MISTYGRDLCLICIDYTPAILLYYFYTHTYIYGDTHTNNERERHADRQEDRLRERRVWQTNRNDDSHIILE